MPEWFDIPCICGQSLKDPIHCAEEVEKYHEYVPQHAYESGPDNVCITCGAIGSYAHTSEYFNKYAHLEAMEYAYPCD